jgi:hypothetical protein
MSVLRLIQFSIVISIVVTQGWEDLLKSLPDYDNTVLEAASKDLAAIPDATKCAAVSSENLDPTSCSSAFQHPEATCCYIKTSSKAVCSPFVNYSVPIYKKLFEGSKIEMTCGVSMVFDIVKLATTVGISEEKKIELTNSLTGVVNYPKEYEACVSVNHPDSSEKCISKVTNNESIKCCYFNLPGYYIPERFCGIVFNNVGTTYNTILGKIGGSMVCDNGETKPQKPEEPIKPSESTENINDAVFTFNQAVSQLSIDEQKAMAEAISKIPDDAQRCLDIQSPFYAAECTTLFFSPIAKCSFIRVRSRGKEISLCAPIATELLSEFNDLIVKVGGSVVYKLPAPEVSIPLKDKLSELNQYDYMFMEKDLYRLYLEIPKETALCAAKAKPSTVSHCSDIMQSDKASCCFVKDSSGNGYCSPVGHDAQKLYNSSIQKVGGSIVCEAGFHKTSILLIFFLIVIWF